MTLEPMRYVPALKAKEAEIKALLRSPESIEIVPLFELQPASASTVDPETGEVRRGKSTTTDASYFLDDIARLWEGPLYVDTVHVANGQESNWWKLLGRLNALSAIQAELIPVVRLDDDDDALQAASEVASATDRAALRVDMRMERSRTSDLATICDRVSRLVQVGLREIDVILDWQDGMHESVISLDDLELDTREVLASLGDGRGRAITLGTPQLPPNLQAGDWEVDRREWWLWLRLQESKVDVIYGDFALYPPTVPGFGAPRYGHLRYSSGDQLHVHRRSVSSGGGGLAGAFRECCKHLVGSDHYLGIDFSRADRRFHDISVGSDKESQAGVWRQLASEHHFQLVATQLAHLPSAPPSRTP